MKTMGVDVTDAEVKKMIGSKSTGISYPEFHQLILNMSGNTSGH